MSSVSTDRRQGLNSGAAFKVPCKAGTAGAITLSGEQTIDGVACVTGDRVLVKNQASAANNGVYVVDTGTWTRDLDFDGTYDVVQGTIVTVINGTTNSNTAWRVSSAAPFVIGTSSISFVSALFNDATALIFLQAGTGAVARSVQSKLRDCIDLADFGVLGDGTDETTKVQAAVDAAISTGKKNITAHGMMASITTAIVAASEVHFDFYGGAGFKALAPFVDITVAGIQECVLLHLKGANNTVDGVTFDCDNLTGPNGFVPIWCDVAAANTHIRFSTFKNIYYFGGGFVSAAVLMRANPYSSVRFCDFINVAAGPTTQGGRQVVFDSNMYLGNATGTRDTAFGMDGGIECQITNNTIEYNNGAGTITSIIGVTSGAVDFLVSGNQINSQNSGVGIYVWDAGGVSPAYGTISNNMLDGKSIAGTAIWVAIRCLDGTSNITIEGNTVTAGATGFASSLGIDVPTSAMVVRSNTMTTSGVAAAINVNPSSATGGYCDISQNYISTNSNCVKVDSATNQGKIIWIRDNQFFTAALGVNCNGATEANTPVYMKDNNFNDVANGASSTILGTRWDPAFIVGGADAGHKPHYCGKSTVIAAAAVPAGTWATGGGSFVVGDVFWSSVAASGATPGWVCTTAGVAGVGAVFKAMANLA